MFQAKAIRRRRFESRSLRGSVKLPRRGRPRRLTLESLEPRQMLTGTWSALANLAPYGGGTMELLSDGTIMVSRGAGGQYAKLNPDAAGNYVNGTWSSLASTSIIRFYDATNVLPDGRVLVIGAEFSGTNSNVLTWSNTGEIYDPVANTWSGIAPFPESTFGGPSMLLPNGTILAGSMNGPNTYIYDPVANSWSPGPTKLYNDSSQFETWTKLPDGSILSYDLSDNLGAGSTEAQRLDISSMTWVDAGAVPVPLASSRPSIGPAVLLPDGQVFQVGGNSNTALYDPSTNTWTAGPVIPSGLGGNHAAAAMLTNGKVFFDASGTPTYGGPTDFFEYDPVANSLTSVAQPTNLSATPSYVTRMLALPSGQVLFDFANKQLYVYTPDGAPQAAWQPTISGVVANGDGTFTLTGTQLNGLSAGASYGSPAEMDSNYPIVELNNGAGQVYFARTFGWSSTGVATGSTPVSTEFSLPTTIPYGTYSLTVIANGIASAPVSFTGGYETDLSVTNTGPATSTEGSNVTYSLSVTNNGPTATTGVVLTDTLDANLKYVSATESQGSVAPSGSVVTFSFGTVGVGQTVTATVTAQTLEDGTLNNSASVTSNLPDPNLSNNTSATTVAVAEPAIVVSAPKVLSGKSQSNVIVATFTHASGVEPANAFSATINWGDNSNSQGTITQSGTTYTVKGSHTYAKNSSYTVTTTVIEAGNSPNLAVASPASTTSTASPATSIGTASDSASTATGASANSCANPRDAFFAKVAEMADGASPAIGKSDWAGAQPVADTDALDGLFERLGSLESDALQVAKSDALVS